jgi:hypothetical protein
VGNVRQKEELMKIGYMRVSKQEKTEKAVFARCRFADKSNSIRDGWALAALVAVI